MLQPRYATEGHLEKVFRTLSSHAAIGTTQSVQRNSHESWSSYLDRRPSSSRYHSSPNFSIDDMSSVSRDLRASKSLSVLDLMRPPPPRLPPVQQPRGTHKGPPLPLSSPPQMQPRSVGTTLLLPTTGGTAQPFATYSKGQVLATAAAPPLGHGGLCRPMTEQQQRALAVTSTPILALLAHAQDGTLRRPLSAATEQHAKVTSLANAPAAVAYAMR